ncbi:MAG: hypothetical protein QOF83_2581 [Solirubrobacteraceae bacterium]|nr:hypothetical protein [Solirubrobacteraceae bacterium]
MQFNRDEYAFLSRRGSVPAAGRSPRRPVPESEPDRDPDARRGRPRATPRPVRAAAGRPVSRVRAATTRRIGAAGDYRHGVRATWTAFGSGGQDEFGGR